ncbi:MAG TPA: GNAT family N-acetyltransferase [Flavipsychrobacter sp.]
MLSFKTITPADREYTDVFNLREEILRKPLGLSLHNEDLGNEVNDYILVAEADDTIVACLILTPHHEQMVQLRQMAVAENMQGKNIGRQLVEYAEQFAWGKGYIQVMLHARMVAKGFYEKLGYRQQGGIFTEVNIPHVEMVKDKP